MEHTDQSGWIINLNYLSNPLPTLQSTQARSARAISPDDCQPAGLCDSLLLSETPGGETGLFRRIVKRPPGGGSNPLWHPCVFCLLSFFMYPDGSFWRSRLPVPPLHACFFPRSAPQARPLSLCSFLHLSPTLLQRNMEWRLKTQPTLPKNPTKCIVGFVPNWVFPNSRSGDLSTLISRLIVALCDVNCTQMLTSNVMGCFYPRNIVPAIFYTNTCWKTRHLFFLFSHP